MTLSVVGNGGVAPSSQVQSYQVNSTATLQATSAPGYIFLGWTVNNTFAGLNRTLSLTMSADHIVVASFAPYQTFPDVPDRSAYSVAVARLYALGVTRGYQDGRFGPNDTTARSQMAGFIARAMGWDAENHGTFFPDQQGADPNLWRNVGTLNHYGVAKGYTNGKFGPHDKVTQGQTIAFITRAMVAKGYWTLATVDDPSVYPTVPAASGFRLELVTFARYAGDVPGYPRGGAWPTLDSPANRAWFAMALDLALSTDFETTP